MSDTTSRDVVHVGIGSLLLDPEAACLIQSWLCTVFMGTISKLCLSQLVQMEWLCAEGKNHLWRAIMSPVTRKQR